MAQHAQFIFLCVPSWAHMDVLRKIEPYILKDTILVSLAKGIDPRSGETIDVMAEKIVSKKSYALLSGPMIAEELTRGGHGSAMVASHNLETAEKVQSLFAKAKLYVEISHDVEGVAICGVLKNIYSILLGFADGAGYSHNEKGFVMTQIMHEMQLLVLRFKGKKETALSLAGIGDLIATGSSRDSTNYMTGINLAKKKKSDVRSEGYNALQAFKKILGPEIEKYTLLSFLVNDVLK